MNTFAKTFAAGAIVGVLAALTQATPASAVSQTLNFTVTADDSDPFVDFGPFSGAVGTGSFTFDDALVVTGDDILTPNDGLTISFTIFGQTFSETDDQLFDGGPTGFPQLIFSGGDIFGLSFGVREDGFLVDTPIAEPGVLGFDMFFLSDDGSGGLAGDIFLIVDDDVAAVPVPATMPLMAGAIGALAFAARRRPRRRAA